MLQELRAARTNVVFKSKRQTSKHRMDVGLRLSKSAWDAQRFGLTPRKWIARLSNRKEPRVFCVSIPKSGTHLLERALCLHPRLYRRLVPTLIRTNIARFGGLPLLFKNMAPGEIVMAHLYFTPERLRALEAHQVKSIFIVRDPRDVAVSTASYVRRARHHELHAVFNTLPDTRSRIMLALRGYPDAEWPSVREAYDLFQGWMHSGPLLVRFEDLVGKAGGGCDEKQMHTLRQIYDTLGLDVSDGMLQHIRAHLFSRRSPTFNKGMIGRWKDHFDPELKVYFKETTGEALRHYGYEKNDHW